jgi:hypothetical protein
MGARSVLLDLLAQTDELGIDFTLSADRQGVRAYYLDSTLRNQPLHIPDELLSQIRAYKPQILQLLIDHPVPSPESIPFVSLNLDYLLISADIAPPIALGCGNRTYYRLSSRVLFWIGERVDRAYRSEIEAEKRNTIMSHAPLLDWLRDWVYTHFRPDQIERGWRNRHELPTIATERPPMRDRTARPTLTTATDHDEKEKPHRKRKPQKNLTPQLFNITDEPVVSH